MTTQISTQNIQSASLAVLEGPKITNIQITNSGGTVLDDTAVALTGGYIKLTGSGFQTGCQIKVGSVLATSVTFVSSTEVRAQVAAASAGTYDVFFTNPDGSTAIRVNGLTYSATPTWVTASTLDNQAVDVAISIQLQATDATTYSLQAGSSLPAGVTLSSGGLISGTVTGITEQTTYNFTVEAVDNELQDSPRAFSMTVTVGPPPGTLWSWGLDGYDSYFLGLNQNNISRSSPTQIGSLADWQLISTSASNTLLVKDNGTLWAFGKNNYGQLGLNDIITRSSPTQIGSGTDWKQCSSGPELSLAIKANGTLWTWGRNNAGQLGLGNTVYRSSPVQVGTSTDWKSVHAGYYCSFGLKTDGTIWAWGSNGNGALGQNSPTSVDRSSPVQIGSDTNWLDIKAYTGIYGGIALKTTGTLWVWGNNSSGQLGLNDRVYRSSPTQVGSNSTWSNLYSTTKSFAASKNDGTLWLAGDNSLGQLGFNTTTNRSSPTQLGNTNDWSIYSGGDQHSMFLKSNSTLWLVGRNAYGQLGLNTQGDPASRSSPVQVGSNSNWIDIEAGSYNSFARRSV